MAATKTLVLCLFAILLISIIASFDFADALKSSGNKRNEVLSTKVCGAVTCKELLKITGDALQTDADQFIQQGIPLKKIPLKIPSHKISGSSSSGIKCKLAGYDPLQGGPTTKCTAKDGRSITQTLSKTGGIMISTVKSPSGANTAGATTTVPLGSQGKVTTSSTTNQKSLSSNKTNNTSIGNTIGSSNLQSSTPSPEIEPIKPQLSPSNDLVFTYDSSQQPWSADELAKIQRLVSMYYPYLREFLGPPIWSGTVNIKKDIQLPYDGTFNPATKEITLKMSSISGVTLDGFLENTLLHEMVHAFQGPYVVIPQAYYEGMHTAIVGTVLEHFNLPYVQNQAMMSYQNRNKPAIRSLDGQFVTDMVSLSGIRYDMASSVFRKAYLEDSNFFRNFHNALFTQMSTDPSVKDNIQKLNSIFVAVKPTIEGQNTLAYLDSQQVFRTDAPSGRQVYLINNDMFLSLFFFDREGGKEIFPFNGCKDVTNKIATGQLAVKIKYYDYKNDFLFEKDMTCSAVSFFIPESYFISTFNGVNENDNITQDETMRVKAVAEVTYEGTKYTDEVWLAAQTMRYGIYGTVPYPYNSGTVTIDAIGQDVFGENIPIPVTKGSFSVSMGFYPAGGTFKITFNSSDGNISTFVVNKPVNSSIMVIMT